MAKPRTIVLVEGMKPAAERLSPALDEAGYHVVTARTKRDALAKVQETHPMVIVLDIPSLRFSGPRFCNALTKNEFRIPLLALLAEGTEPDEGLVADDYLWYPISVGQLVEHVAGLLTHVLQVGDVIFNATCSTVVHGKHNQRLTPKQAELLEIFMRHPGQVLTRAFLMKQVWQTDYLGDTRTLDVHVSWLRKAIEEDPSSPSYLRTIRGVGYCFEEPERQ